MKQRDLKAGYAHRILFLALISLCGYGCFDDSPVTPADTASLWSRVVASGALPDTMLYGDSVAYRIEFGDSAGSPVQLQVSGLPSRWVTITQNGDSAAASVLLIADSLRYDSLYTIRITARGSGPLDSLTHTYTVRLIDMPSLWSPAITGSFPDTVLYGDTVSYRIAIGDNAGRPVQLQVSGLPTRWVTLVQNGDTAVANVVVAADSLRFDSLYTVRIVATGSGPADTATRIYTLFVVDPERKGGLRTLVLGQWWEETQYDTLVSIKDSANVRTTVQVTLEHRKHSEVMSVVNRSGVLQYRIQTSDTVLRQGSPDSLATSSFLLLHSDTAVHYNVPVNNIFIDTLKYFALRLPARDGGQWTVLADSIDTSGTIGGGSFSLDVLLRGSLRSDGDYGLNGSCNFAGNAYACRAVNRPSVFSFTIISDSTVTNPVNGDTLLALGDTVAVSSSNSVQNDHFNFDLSASFWSRDVETKFDTNYVDSTTKRENNIKFSTLRRYSDPRRAVIGN